jgi:hypothetical protein
MDSFQTHKVPQIQHYILYIPEARVPYRITISLESHRALVDHLPSSQHICRLYLHNAPFVGPVHTDIRTGLAPRSDCVHFRVSKGRYEHPDPFYTAHAMLGVFPV